MCYKCDNSEMAGLHIGHVGPIQKQVNEEIKPLVPGLFQSLTKSLNPHLPVLPALVAMAEAEQAGDYGVLESHRLVRLPLSLIGSDRVRYRTKTVEQLHESILSLNMSEITIQAVRGALRPYGLCITFLCSCGLVMGRCVNVRAFFNSDTHVRMDRLRSAIDAAGSPVISVASLEAIPVATMDLHQNGAEARLFARIEELIAEAAMAGHRDYHWIDEELSAFLQLTKCHEVAA